MRHISDLFPGLSVEGVHEFRITRNSDLYIDDEEADNLLRTILDGVQHPATRDIGFMPAFRHNLSDAQIESLARYMRQRFAPDQPAWRDLPADIARLRAAPVETD